MPNVSVARRYARALLDVASEANALDAIASQLTGLAAAIDQNPELRDVLVNPAYSRTQRTQVLGGVVASLGGIHALLGNTLQLLTERGRLDSIPDISRLFRDMADARAGRVRGQVTTAVALGPDVLKRLEETLEKVTQRDVVLETRVDPSVLGGVSAQVGSMLYDGTLRSQLEGMRRQLKRV